MKRNFCFWVPLLLVSTWFLEFSPVLHAAISSGEFQTGSIGGGSIDTYTFSGNAGDNVVVRVGTTNFVPLIDLYAPGGALVTNAFTANGANRDAVLYYQLTNSGTFTISVSSYYAGGTGTYGLKFGQIPGPFTVPAGEAGGAMTNGATYTGEIMLGGFNLWSFSGTAGDSIELRMGGTNFSPRIDLYGPDGSVLTNAFTANGSYRDAWLALRLTNSGTFTVVVSSYFLNTYGGYSLSLAKAPGTFVVSPGQQGGALTNGSRNDGLIGLGGLQMWAFSGNSGDSIQLRMGATNFSPRIALYGPDGSLLTNAFTANGAYRDAWLAIQLTNSGTFTVVVSSYFLNTFGGYSLNLAQIPEPFKVSPGEQGGTLVNGLRSDGQLGLGDLGMWAFSGMAGDSIQLRMGATNFSPFIDLYGPDGSLLIDAFTANTSYRDAWLTLRLTNSGTFTVVVGSYFLNAFGGYSLNLAQIPGSFTVAPGDIGGALTNGFLEQGTLGLGGMDMWAFSGQTGDNIELRMGSAAFSPRIDLYGPDGGLLTNAFTPNGSYRDAALDFQLKTNGTFTAVVSSYFLNTWGDYTLKLAQEPGPVFVAPGDDGGIMTNGFTYQGTNIVGDLDVWSFYGTPGDSNLWRISTVNFTPYLRLYGPDGALVAEAYTPNGSVRTNFLSYVVTNAGNYTLVSSAYFLNQSGTYSLKQSRVPPDLILPDTQTIDEGATLTVPVSAQDPDDPAKSLTFLLVSAPPGVSLTTLGPTNAALSWTTTEADGPSTNVIAVSVTDVVLSKPFTRTNSFTVVVNEINTPPVLPLLPSELAVNELTPFLITNTATDADIPANALTYSLLNAPPGMTIDTNGIIRWTPTEAQGPGTNTIVTVVTDYNPWAVNSQHLSATNSFTLVVNEVNTAPVLPVVLNQTVNELTTLTVTNTASDSDIPPNPLSYQLLNPPPGASIDANGIFTWTPTEAQGPSTNLIVTVVTDSNPYAVNSQHLSTTNRFQVVVNEINTAPVLPVIPPQAVNELTTLTVTNSATDSDIPANPLTYTMINPPQGVTIDANGIITWTPSEAQGPGTNIITTVVTDTNAFAVNSRQLSATNSFRVVVNEVNSPPVLQPIAAQSIHYGLQLSVQATATDPDIPANILTFSLVAAPTNMTINANSGLITWTPVLAQLGSNTVTVKVTDNGQPPLSDTTTFYVLVIGQQPQLSAQALPGNLVQLNITGDIGVTYQLQTSTNLMSWSVLTAITPNSSPYPYIDPSSSSIPRRFYRLLLSSGPGVAHPLKLNGLVAGVPKASRQN